MRAKVDTLVKRVLVRLNENEEELENAVIYGDMGMELRRLAAELLPDAARRVFQTLPVEEISEAKDFSGSYRYTAEGFGVLEMPADFLRLVEVKMEGWPKALYGWSEDAPTLGPEGTESGDGQTAPTPKRYRVLGHHEVYSEEDERGGEDEGERDKRIRAFEPWMRPVMRGEGRAAQVRVPTRDARVETAFYLPEPEIDEGRIWIPSGSESAIVAETVSMIKAVLS